MRKFTFVALVALFLAVGLFLGVSSRISQAQVKSFKNIVPFSSLGGYIGFFDQDNGKVYFYDDELKETVFIYQLTELGKPATEVLSPGIKSQSTGITEVDLDDIEEEEDEEPLEDSDIDAFAI